MEKEIESIKADEELNAQQVFRALHETIFFIRFLWFRLTEIDVLLSAGVGLAVWFVVQQTGNEKAVVFGLFKFDPWGWGGTILLTATVISIFHKLRPEGDIEKVVYDFFQKKVFVASAAIKDKKWSLGAYRR